MREGKGREQVCRERERELVEEGKGKGSELRKGKGKGVSKQKEPAEEGKGREGADGASEQGQRKGRERIVRIKKMFGTSTIVGTAPGSSKCTNQSYCNNQRLAQFLY